MENWSLRFKAKAGIRGWIHIMKGNMKVPPANAVTTDKEELKAREWNNKGYYALLLSMKCEKDLDTVSEACTKDLPEGDLYISWVDLCNKYEPTDPTTKINLLNQFHECKLNNYDDVD